MPSKLLGMMASGRPVVACADAGASLAAVVSECGMVVAPEDGSAVADAIGTLAENRDKRLSLGNAARRRAVRDWGRDAVLSYLLGCFEEQGPWKKDEDRTAILPEAEAPSE